MNTSTIKELKAGEYFMRKADSKKVFTRAEYCRDTKNTNVTTTPMFGEMVCS